MAATDSTRAVVNARSLTTAIDSMLQAPADSVALPEAAVSAMELQVLLHWDDEATRSAGAADYQLARNSAQAGEPAASLQHLERAVLAHPMHADAALADHALETIRGPVLELVGRVNVLARMRAETSIDAATAALEPGRTSGSAGHAPEARAYLDIAQAHFQLGIYAGYVLADQAAILAQKIAAGSDIPLRVNTPTPGTDDQRSPALVRRVLWQATRRLWQRLPLLVILLGWLVAGMVAGVASLPFREGSIAELRQLLAPIWALGLLGIVALGFIRSIRQFRRHGSR